MAKCKQCVREFQPAAPGKGRPQVYCEKACGEAWRYQNWNKRKTALKKATVAKVAGPGSGLTIAEKQAAALAKWEIQKAARLAAGATAK